MLPPKSIKPDGVSKQSLAIATFSTVVEWYDFTLYLYFATVLSRIFFDESGESLLIVLAGFAVSYLLRPLGAMVFGHIGDKYGRKQMLMGSMALMTVAMLATACLPTQDQWGYAGVAMIVLRCLMAFSVGAEYTGVVAYLLEGSQNNRRGLMSSLAAASSEVGALLAVLVCSIVVQLVPTGELERWGWRIPFVIGGLLALMILFFRQTMGESPKFITKSKPVVKSPLLLTLNQHKRAIVNSFVISALGSITYYVGIVYVPIFLTSQGNFAESHAFWLSTMMAVAVIAITPMVGVLSDRLGRRPVLIGLGGLGVILPMACFWLMLTEQLSFAILGGLLLAVLAGAVSAVGASATAEQFSTTTRLSGLALGTTMATAIFGGFAPYVAQHLLQKTDWVLIPAIMIAMVALMALPVFFKLKETAFDELT